MKYYSKSFLLLLFLFLQFPQWTVAQSDATLRNRFLSPPEDADSWCFWYWMYGAVSREGITADLEAMKQVTEAEEANRARRVEAQAEAKRLVAEAERAGKARLAEARAQAEAQARELMRQAEAKAAEHASEVMAQTRKSCDALRAQAEARLADAAESIVRRVVKTNVHC